MVKKREGIEEKAEPVAERMEQSFSHLKKKIKNQILAPSVSN